MSFNVGKKARVSCLNRKMIEPIPLVDYMSYREKITTLYSQAKCATPVPKYPLCVKMPVYNTNHPSKSFHRYSKIVVSFILE
jgi:hypothetical protein